MTNMPKYLNSFQLSDVKIPTNLIYMFITILSSSFSPLQQIYQVFKINLSSKCTPNIKTAVSLDFQLDVKALQIQHRNHIAFNFVVHPEILHIAFTLQHFLEKYIDNMVQIKYCQIRKFMILLLLIKQLGVSTKKRERDIILYFALSYTV